jgi:hypothetical protein
VGATLTIEAGVTVLFNQSIGLTVNGRLLAEGNETNPILFTRAAGATDWSGVTINGGVNSPETRINHAHFEFNGSTAIDCAGAAVRLDHLTFGSTDHRYVSLDGASFIVSDCAFPSATAAFEMVHGTGGIREGGRGIFLRNFFGVPIGYSDAVDFTGGNRPGPIVQFINNVFVGATDDILDLDGTDGWVEGNIFLHSHKNGAPDSSAAVSGGNSGANTSEVTIIGNLFFDCDQAATAKQGNFYTLINNTIVHTTKTGGLDTESGVVCVRDLDPSPTTFGAGFYLEGNIIVDAEQLARNYDAAQTMVTFNNNILPSAWNGPGTGNIIADPLLKHIPQLSETVFTNWAEAQIVRDWLSLLPGSPALGTGPNGHDKGGVIPLGASISVEPSGTTSQTTATLTVEVNRTGNGIPAADWPNGSGYTHYKWRLDGGPWSAETPLATPITLSRILSGPHSVEVVGKRDSGFYQDDPAFGVDAVITRSRTWTVNAPAFVVGGTLSSNTTWTPSLGEIHVIADVVVPTNVTLSMAPGTVVRLTNDVSIIAQAGGGIEILGSETNKVFFSRLNGTNNWGQLSARGTNASLTVLHAEIVGGQTSVYTNATALFEDSYFHDYGVLGASGSANNPILLTQFAGSVTVRRCHFQEYYETLFRYGVTTIEDSLFENIHGDGIDFDFAVPGSAIRRCTVRHGNGINIDAVDIGSFSDGVVIEDCLMLDFPFDKGVSIGEHSQNITVRNCVIYGVESGVAVKDSSVATIYNNTLVDSDYGLRLYEKIAGEGGGHATAYNNIIWSNTNSISLANGSTITVSYSDVAGTGIYPGTNNLNADPLFLDAAARDYRLRSNSPCIGAGLDGASVGALGPVGGVPSAPGNLVAALWQGTNVYLSWSDNSSYEAGFEIQRSVNGTDWNSRVVAEANETNFVDAAVQPGATYYYRVRAKNLPGDSDFSNEVIMTLPLPPTIVTQPVSQTASPGDDVTFTVSATGSEPLHYQWRAGYLPGDIPGATSDTLVLTNVQAGMSGNIRVIVSNPAGSVMSAIALLSVVPPPSLGNVRFDGTNVVGSFASASNLTYTVEYKNTLSDPAWLTLRTVNGDGGTLTFSDGMTNLPSRFYRIRVP